MQMNPLGRTGMTVTELCLGSMTWASQNTEAEGHRQIDMALDHGVNFIDTAEMYPANPPAGAQCGDTEAILGTWIAANRARRKSVIVATKVSGAGMRRLRDGAPISRATIAEAVAGSLKRLQTDVIDLYQLHWPNRGSYMFRQNWGYDPTRQDSDQVADHMAEVIDCMDELVKAGTVRAFGLSNESAWGTARWLAVAEARGGPRVASMQNEYSLMCRLYDTDMAELSHHEDVGLLAFSPLACGILSGKYQGDATPEGSRRALGGTLGGRMTPRTLPAAQAYLDIAKRHGLDPCQMALAWCRTRPFMASAIFGATKEDQLETALKSVEVTLSGEVMEDIDAAHRAHPMPF
ncbi:MAG: aldo/keto reductase [Pseudomonadota bacterium]